MTPDPIEHAIIAAATGVLARRADVLRVTAATATSTVDDKGGQSVMIIAPEGRAALNSAALFDSIAADIAAPTLDALGSADPADRPQFSAEG